MAAFDETLATEVMVERGLTEQWVAFRSLPEVDESALLRYWGVVQAIDEAAHGAKRPRLVR
jgi:hypothetical protein